MINPSNNIFLWNCRGATSSSFHRFCKQYLDVHHPDVVVVMETRVDPLKLQRTFGLLGFDGFLSTDVQGYAGGIVVVWKTAQLHITLLRREFQFLHLRVNMGNMAEWFFTPIYASPNEEARRGLRADLRRLSSSVQSPWLLAADFNDIAHSGEKKGGAPVSQRKSNVFVQNIDACHLLDLGAIGSKFTWRGPLFNGWSRIYERLDRALSNSDWRLLFPEAYVKVLPRVDFSDHHPLLILPFGNMRGVLPSIFRFESAWLVHENFTDAVQSGWEKELSVPDNLNKLTTVLSTWKTNVYGSTRKRKRQLLNRIGGIQ